MSVAEVSLALVSVCSKNIIQLSRQMRRGERPNKKFKNPYSATLLTGNTFGIVGGGKIGRICGEKVVNSFIDMSNPY